MSAAGLGVWDRPQFPETYDFLSANELAVTRTDDAGDEHVSQFTYVYAKDDKKLVTKAKSSGIEKIYSVQVHTETKLELDDGEGTVVSLIPSGYDGGCGLVQEENDDDDSGVDMGMDLCVVGTKIAK